MPVTKPLRGLASRRVGVLPWRKVLRASAAVASVSALVAAGWLAASILVSPDQQAAQALAPSALPIGVPVQKGTLSEVTTASAQVVSEVRVSAVLNASGTPAVVTAVIVAPGGQVAPATAVLAVNDRPVFAMPGAFFFYRDMVQGDSGADIVQLQGTLRAAGFSVPDSESGVFGRKTRSAIVSLYERAGFPIAVGGGGAMVYVAPKSLRWADTVVVPLSEVLTFSMDFPATCGDVPSVGESVTADSTVTLVGGALVATAEIPSGTLLRLRSGMEATLAVQDGDSSVIAVVIDSITPGDEAASKPGSITLRAATPTPIPPDWATEEVLATITISTVAEDSLIVPTRAVLVDGDGQASVLVLRAGTAGVVVPVRVKGELGGRSAIAPMDAGALAVGDLVVVD